MVYAKFLCTPLFGELFQDKVTFVEFLCVIEGFERTERTNNRIKE
jgi:hypothetical protein